MEKFLNILLWIPVGIVLGLFFLVLGISSVVVTICMLPITFVEDCIDNGQSILDKIG